MTKILCACGCGEEIVWKKRYNQPKVGYPKFIQGHYSKCKHYKDMYGKRKLIIDKNEKHFCKCDCGEEIVWKKNYKQTGWAKYIKGHRSKLMKLKRIEEENKIKKKLSFCKCGCGQKIILTKWTKYKIPKFIHGHYSKSRKGHTFEDDYGLEKAIKMINNLKYINKGKKKGTWEEQFGKEKADKLRKSRIKLFDINLLKKTLKNVFKYENNITKSDFYKYKFVTKIFSEGIIRNGLKKNNLCLDDVAKECNLYFISGHINGKTGNNEIEILDYYAKINNVEIDKDFHVGKLKPDGAIHKQKLFIEVDEPHHPYQQIQDKIREERIKKLTGYNFIRLPEKEWLYKISNVKTLGDF